MTNPLSVWRVAVRPRWLAALALALVVAAVFAALGQWQLERSIASATIIERDTETVIALDALEIAHKGLSRRGVKDSVGLDETHFLNPLFQIAESRLTPAEELICAYERRWHKKIDPVFKEYAY